MVFNNGLLHWMLENDRYQKTAETLSGATSLFGGLGGSLAKKLGDVKSSTAFKSFEERVGTAVGSVKVGLI